MKDWCLLSVLVVLLTSLPSAAEVFSHRTAGSAWEAEVTRDAFTLRETRKGTTGGSHCVCPFGPAVRASVLRTVSGAARLCFVFSADRCAYRSADGAPAGPIAQRPGMGVFKCVDFLPVENADALAALVNAGTRTQQPVAPARASAGPDGQSASAREGPVAQSAGATRGGASMSVRAAAPRPAPAADAAELRVQ